jgi:anti-anti-sigma factor
MGPGAQNHNRRLGSDRNGAGPVRVVVRDGQTTLVRLAGELDMATMPLVREALERECERRPLRLTLELGAVEFLDSSALNLLVAIHRRLRAEGSDLVLDNPSEVVAHTMRIAQLHRLFTITHETVPDATASFGSSLRVALIAPPWFPVPPPAYGGTEAIVALLADGLVKRGVDVTVFASGDSRTSAKLEYVHPTARSVEIGQMAVELEHVLACLSRAEEFDLIHDHSGLLALTLATSVQTPFVHTAHGPLLGHSGVLYSSALGFNPRASLISLTRAQQRAAPHLPWIAVCPNGIDVDRFPFRAGHDGYLAFLGRMSPEKGAGHAVAVARDAGMELRIAAKCREPAEKAYFDAEVRPHLGGGIEYVGELDHDDKCVLLRDARALLAPIDWEEPFGLVFAEAAACGTPVVATRRGSVPEVIVDGLTGFYRETREELPAALQLVDGLDPHAMRRHAEEHFTSTRMVDDYLAAYSRVVEDVEEPLALTA